MINYKIYCGGDEAAFFSNIHAQIQLLQHLGFLYINTITP